MPIDAQRITARGGRTMRRRNSKPGSTCVQQLGDA
jgi:hypothetical protein